MGFEAAVGTINIGTGAISTNYSVTGKTPATGTWKAVKFWWSGRSETTDAAGEQDSFIGVGFAVSSSSRCCSTISSDQAAATTATMRYQTNAHCIVQVVPTSTTPVGLVDFVSFDADGFTVIIDDVLTGAMEVNYLLLGGTDLTNAEIGVFTLVTGVSTNNYDGVTTFQPDFAFFNALSQFAQPVGGTFSYWGYGAATAAEQYTQSVFSQNAAAASQTGSYCLGGECWSAIETRTTIIQRHVLESFRPTGFRIQNLTSSKTYNVNFLALKGGTYKMGDFLTATNTTAFTEAHGMAVTPKAALFVSSNRVQSTTAVGTVVMEWSMGASDGTNNYCAYAREKDNAADADCFTAVSHDQCYLNADNSATQVLEGEGHVNSFDATNINFQMTDADPAQSFVWYVAFGDTPASANVATSRTYLQAVKRAGYY